MKSLRTKLVAWTATAALGAVSLFAASTSPAGPQAWHRHHRAGAFMASYLNLTAAQQAQEKSIFQGLRQQAQPLRQELRQTRQEMRTAVQANNVAQIQQLAKNEGSEFSQLATLRGQAMAKAYQVLTPAQQQKAAELRQAHKAAREARQGERHNNQQ